MTSTPALYVLDLVPVRYDQHTGDALAASLQLAATADRLGYRRYWVAEHHNMPSVAATNPPVLISMIAAHTRRIRVGSGGVMLPNHAPLVVAEQFALLEAAYPGRIDLGIGRAPGTDPVTRYALRDGAGGVGDDPVAQFPSFVEDVRAMMAPDGVRMRVGERTHHLNATPSAATVPDLWLLGSSDYSARLAAATGVPYVFAHHFSGKGTEQALALYRDHYQPSPEHPEPRTFLTVNASVAAAREEAERLALPNQLQMLALHTGMPLVAQRLVEHAEEVAAALPADQDRLINAMRRRWVVDAPDQARAQLRELAGRYDVEEVMVHPVAGAYVGTAVGSAPARERTLELLADW
jgi:luciferase family oxidoreductase group 1